MADSLSSSGLLSSFLGPFAHGFLLLFLLLIELRCQFSLHYLALDLVQIENIVILSWIDAQKKATYCGKKLESLSSCQWRNANRLGRDFLLVAEILTVAKVPSRQVMILRCPPREDRLAP